MSLFRFSWARRRSATRPGTEPPLLVRGDERAARAADAIEEMFASTAGEEARAWARVEQQLDRRPRGRRFWLRGAGVVAATSLVGATAFVVWQGGRSSGTRGERPRSVAAPVETAASAPSPAPSAAEAAGAPSPTTDATPSERPDAAPLAAGTSVISGGARARLSRGGRARYFPAPGVRGYVLLEKGTLTLESPAVSRHDAPAADRPLEVRAAVWRVRGDGRFAVAARGRRVDVVVEEGEVTVWSSLRIVARVVAGEHWTSPPNDEPAVVLPEPDEQPDCLRLARDGVTSAAIACLESQSEAPGLTGELALLELARIRRDVKGDLAGAERLLADHERRFPQSGLATEARSGRIELLLRLGRAAEAYADAKRLPGNEASYWRAVSLVALGRRAEAKDAFDEYLQHPDIQRRREATRQRHELGP
jgi:hypothetical protein